MRPVISVAVLALVLHVLAAQDAPKVVRLEPANFACDVDAKTTTQIVATFDREMNQAAYSICGGGAKLPKFQGKPAWKDEKTLVVDGRARARPGLRAQPELLHEDRLPKRWTAASSSRCRGPSRRLPAKLPNAEEQKKRNQDALATLFKALDEHYSYRDLRVRDWKKLEQDATPALLAAPTDKMLGDARRARARADRGPPSLPAPRRTRLSDGHALGRLRCFATAAVRSTCRVPARRRSRQLRADGRQHRLRPDHDVEQRARPGRRGRQRRPFDGATPRLS